ncbi:MAG: transglutaminase N-terminal domain-containing protein [Labrys sp. (in: a-proteobacteria)]
MRIIVSHETVYRYAVPAGSVTQILRMTPRSHDGQHVVRWRIDLDRDVRLSDSEDAFGNVTHAFHVTGPVDSIAIRVQGEVETQDRAGVVRDSIERFPPSLFLRDTTLTRPNPAITDWVAGENLAETTDLAFCHAIMERLHDRIEPAPLTDPIVGAAETFATKRGRAADLAHLFIACALVRRIPARFVAGHLCSTDGPSPPGHGWAEAHISGLGWVGFDASINLCPTDAHVRVAMGLDHLGAAPIRGARFGGDGEFLDMRTEVRELFSDRQAQRQSQG